MTIDSLFTSFDHYLPKLLAALPVAVLVALGGLIANMIVRRALTLLAHRTNLTESDVQPLRRIMHWTVSLITCVLVLGVFGFELGGVWAILSTLFAMIAIGFVAVWSILSHTSATVLILLLRPFHIGDIIELQSENIKGRVVDLNFFFTTLQVDEHTTHQVPNNLFFQKVVTRIRGEPGVSLASQLGSKNPAILPPHKVIPASEDFAAQSVPDPGTLTAGVGRGSK
jgi:small-conductance mechanosensitive channel